MIRVVALSLVLLSSQAMADNPNSNPLVEFLSAVFFVNNYKVLDELQRINEGKPRLIATNSDETNTIIGSANCRRFTSPDGSGLACLVDDGTWQIVEVYK